MAATLAPDRSRRLAVGLLVAAILAVVLVIAIPVWLLNRHYDQALEESTTRFERFRRIASTRADIARQLEAMRGKDTRKYFLRSGAAALSAAEASEALRGIVDNNGGRLITMASPTTRDEGRYRQITVNVQLTGNIFSLRKILGAIDAHTPMLFVDNITIRTQVPATYRPGPGQEPEMFVNMDVTGYALTGTP